MTGQEAVIDAFLRRAEYFANEDGSDEHEKASAALAALVAERDALKEAAEEWEQYEREGTAEWQRIVAKHRENTAQAVAERDRRIPLEPPYAQVVGQNAVVLLTREQIERVARDYGDYPITAGLACSIGAEMRRALIALDAAAALAVSTP